MLSNKEKIDYSKSVVSVGAIPTFIISTKNKSEIKMNRKNYQKKCRALFKKAHELGVELIFHPENFDYNRLDCLWYGGWLATIELSETLAVELSIYGVVRATLNDRHGNPQAEVTDKGNTGRFSKQMRPYLNTDRQLRNAIRKGRLLLQNNNWIEYDGTVKRNDIPYAEAEFIDLGVMCDNLLSDNILHAIRQALDSLEDIKAEIEEVAEIDYGITGGLK